MRNPGVLSLLCFVLCVGDGGTYCLGQYLDLNEISLAHKNAIEQFFSSTFVLNNGKVDYLYVVGGKSACAIEFSEGTEKRVTCASTFVQFELFQPERSKPFQVTNLLWHRNKPHDIDILRACIKDYHHCFSPLCYFEVPIAKFLADPAVKHEIVSRTSSPYGPVVRVSWEWKNENQLGYFELLPSRNWVAKAYGRTKDPSLGYLVCTHEFVMDTNSPIPIFRKQEKQFREKQWEVTEVDKYRIVSTIPEPPSRFELSYYGIPEHIGKQSSYWYGIVVGAIVLGGGYLILIKFKWVNDNRTI